MLESMMRLISIWFIATAFLVTPPVGQTAEQAIVRPADTGAELTNPGMGWVLHYYDNEPGNYGSRLRPSDTLDGWPGLTAIYLRIPW